MSKPTHPRSADARQPALSRRTVFAGAGAVGAAAAAAAVLPSVVQNAAAPVTTAAAPASGSGYQLTEHVQRYYQTARV